MADLERVTGELEAATNDNLQLKERLARASKDADKAGTNGRSRDVWKERAEKAEARVKELEAEVSDTINGYREQARKHMEASAQLARCREVLEGQPTWKALDDIRAAIADAAAPSEPKHCVCDHPADLPCPHHPKEPAPSAEPRSPGLLGDGTTWSRWLATQAKQSGYLPPDEVEARIAQVVAAERERVCQRLWYGLKTSLGPGKHQTTLNEVVDAIRKGEP
jgi:hypothetical protein